MGSILSGSVYTRARRIQGFDSLLIIIIKIVEGVFLILNFFILFYFSFNLFLVNNFGYFNILK